MVRLQRVLCAFVAAFRANVARIFANVADAIGKTAFDPRSAAQTRAFAALTNGLG
jgi:hypothetical protein